MNVINEATNIPMEFHYLRHSRESGNLPKVALTPCGNIYELFNNLKKNQTLEKLRDTLLPKLLAGEIDLSNIKLDQNSGSKGVA